MLVEGDGWRPTGWLGLVVAGSLWTPLTDTDFDESVSALVEQIKKSVPDDAIADDYGAGADLRAELARLRTELDAGKSGKSGASGDGELATFDPLQPAVVPNNVPALPVDYEETDAVKDLRKLLLQPRTDPNFKIRVGFFGMGGLVCSETASMCSFKLFPNCFLTATGTSPMHSRYLGGTPMIFVQTVSTPQMCSKICRVHFIGISESKMWRMFCWISVVCRARLSQAQL